MMCLISAVYSFQVALDPLQSSQFTEKESAFEVCYVPFVYFFIKSLHFYGKFIANTAIGPFSDVRTSHSVLALLKAEPNFGKGVMYIPT